MKNLAWTNLMVLFADHRLTPYLTIEQIYAIGKHWQKPAGQGGRPTYHLVPCYGGNHWNHLVHKALYAQHVDAYNVPGTLSFLVGFVTQGCEKHLGHCACSFAYVHWGWQTSNCLVGSPVCCTLPGRYKIVWFRFCDGLLWRNLWCHCNDIWLYKNNRYFAMLILLRFCISAVYHNSLFLK